MTDPKQQQHSKSISGQDVFAEVADCSKKLISERLVRMIESTGDYHGWDLSDEDATRLNKLIRYKQRIICSSFAFQLKRHFSEFKTDSDSPSPGAGRHDWEELGISGAGDNAEIDKMESITTRYEEAFKDFDQSILKRLQACIKRPRASVYHNPLQIKRLCESFRYAIDSLNLEVNYRLALYQLFADRFIESLGPLYRQIDLLLLNHGMLPDIPPARIHLRSFEGLSESAPPQKLKLSNIACRLILVQRFKEKARVSTSSYRNYFPELKRALASCGLNEYDEHIDQLNLIFKLIFEDEDLPSPVKQQLARLQIYVFITAIQEDGFLRRSSNPARRLLDGIIGSEVEIACHGNAEFSGVRFIREHIESMASREFITVDSYSEMLDGYQTYVRENERSICRQRKMEATRKVLPLVKERLSDITQPLRMLEMPLILFEKVWLPLLVQIALQQGMDSDAWHKTISIVQKQVWSLIPKENPEEQAELLEVLPTIAHSLHRAMRSLKLAESLQQSLRDYLKLEQQNVAEQTARNIIETKRKTRSLSAQSFDSKSKEDNTEFDELMQTGMFQMPPDMLEAFKTNKPEKSVKIDQVGALSVGDWVNFIQGKAKTLGKLAWKSEESTLFIFIGRDGKRICEVDAGKLARQFESGEVSLSGSDSTDAVKSRSSFMKTL
ncbi:MAG: DUF1631 domain-containing protein [Gammaproteobacteria bacterium]|nr:DUF1631 domain-containing protein [Gammaproteobacteria bacterium]